MLRADFKNQVSKLFGPEMGKNDRFWFNRNFF